LNEDAKMTMNTARRVAAALALLILGTSQAKLPALSDEAKAKAAEAAAKTAHTNKLADFQLCKAMDRVAAGYQATAKKAGQAASAPVATPACADPGAFVYTPPVAASAAAPAPVTAAVAPPAAKK
jgi:hypothetical protein